MESLDHFLSEKIIQSFKKQKIPIKSLLLCKNVPPSNLRQWNNLVTKLSNLLINYNLSENHLLLGFQLNISSTINSKWGPSSDKHAVVLSFYCENSQYYLELMDINGLLDKTGYLRFDTMLLELLYKLKTDIEKKINNKVLIREINPYSLNFGKGHCDLFSLYYIYYRNNLNYNITSLFKKIDKMDEVCRNQYFKNILNTLKLKF